MRALSPTMSLVAFVAFFSALCFTQVSHSYETNKIYNYAFDGSVLSRLANEANVPQHSGVFIKSGLALKKQSDEELVVQLVSPTVAPFNGLIHEDSFDEASSLKYKPFQDAVGLDKPFKVYLDGKGVKAFDAHKDEPKWVSNMKRGLLSFLQIKLESNSNDANAASSEEQRGSVSFTANERSVFGDCDTDYVVIVGGANSIEDSTGGYLNVTKTRNLAKCNSRFMQKFVPIDAPECVTDEKELDKSKHSHSMFTYNLLGSKSNYVIESAKLHEQTVYTPFGQKGISPTIETKFSLTLNTDSATKPSDLSVDSSSVARVDNLAYEPPELLNFYANINLDDEHHLANIYSTRATVDQVMIAYNELADELAKFTSTLEGSSNEKVGYQQGSRTSEMFMRLADLTGTLNAQKLDQLYAKVEETGSDAHKKIFWDLMSIVGTNPSFMFMKKMIVEGEAPSARIKDYLTHISFHVKAPSKALFDEYLNLCKADKIIQNENYKRICSLTLASLINQHCVAPHTKYLRMQQEGHNATHYKRGQNQCQISTAEEYFARLVTVPSQSTSADASSDSQQQSMGDKMLNIKVVGELAVEPAIKMLKSIVRKTEEHPSIRAAAMWSLMKAARVYPNIVKSFSLPYYYDASENLELRIAAFYNAKYSGLSLHDFESIATKLIDEPNRQLVLYVGSFLQSMSSVKTTQCHQPAYENAKLVLPLVKKALQKHASGSMWESHVGFSVTPNHEYNYDSGSHRSLILSNDSFAPSNIYFSTFQLMEGTATQPMTINVQAHGLDKLAKRVKGLFADKPHFMDVFSLKRRAKRHVRGEHLVKRDIADIEKDLKQSARDFNDVYVSLTVSVYGRQVMFVDKDSKELKKILGDDGTIKIPAVKKLLHSFNNHTKQSMMINFERTILFNNEMGMPIMNFIKDFELSTFKLNSIKLDVEPGFFRDERQGKPPTKITASLDARSSKNVDLFAGLTAIMADSKQRFGSGLYKTKLVNIPTKFDLTVDLQDNKVTIKRNPIHENLLFIRQYPLTFVKRYDEYKTDEFKSEVEPWLSLYNFKESQVMKPFEHEYMTPLAIGLNLQGKHRADSDWSFASWRRYVSENNLRNLLFMYKLSPSGSPFEVSVSTVTTGAEANPTKEMTYTFSWKHAQSNRPESEPAIHEIENEVETETNKKARANSVHYTTTITGGSDKERKVSVDFQYSKAFNLRKWKVFYQRTPFDTSSDTRTEATNLCLLASAKYPQYNMDKFYKFDLLSADHTVNVTSNLIFGEECSSDKVEFAPSRIIGTGTFGWSHEQRAATGMLLAGQSHCPLSKTYRKCLKAQSEGKQSSTDENCIDVLKRMTDLLHVDAHFNYKNVPERWIKIGTRLGALYSYARANYIEEIEDDLYSKNGSNKANESQEATAHLSANFTLDKSDRKVSYSYENPNIRVKYSNVPISLPMMSSFPRQDEKSSHY